MNVRVIDNSYEECLLPLREKVPNGRMRGDQTQGKYFIEVNLIGYPSSGLRPPSPSRGEGTL
jgi:hypothetical protein